MIYCDKEVLDHARILYLQKRSIFDDRVTTEFRRVYTKNSKNKSCGSGIVFEKFLSQLTEKNTKLTSTRVLTGYEQKNMSMVDRNNEVVVMELDALYPGIVRYNTRIHGGSSFGYLIKKDGHSLYEGIPIDCTIPTITISACNKENNLNFPVEVFWDDSSNRWDQSYGYIGIDKYQWDEKINPWLTKYVY